MTGILAIETATDACSVAVFVDGQIRERHEVAPRQHSQLIFAMLEELLPGGTLKEQGIDLIAYGCGPGSFTGLRIAASTVQGLAYSCDLPVVAVSTLAVLAQSALHQGSVSSGDSVLCTIDARINEVYAAVYEYSNDMAVMREGPWACAPADLLPTVSESLCIVGDGCRYFDEFSSALRDNSCLTAPKLVPAARDIIPLALDRFESGDIQLPAQVQPVYVRDEITWKKIAEQGRRI